MSKPIVLFVLATLGLSACVTARSDLVDPVTMRYRVETEGGRDEAAHAKAFHDKAKKLCPKGYRVSKFRFTGQGRRGLEAAGYVKCNENLL